MNNKKQQLLDILRLKNEIFFDSKNYLELIIRHSIIDTNTIKLFNDIISETIIETLKGQIPEILSIDSIVGMDVLSFASIMSFVSFAYYKQWNLKPILMSKITSIIDSKKITMRTYGNLRKKDNVIILNAVLNGDLVLKGIDSLIKQKTNVIEIISLIDPLDGSKEKLIEKAYQPISIYTINDFKRKLKNE